MGDQMMIQLSHMEAEYIGKLVSEDNSFRDSFLRRPELHSGRWTLVLEPDEVRRMAIYFALRMARVGFDEDYEPNKEGLVIEGLQDKLILPSRDQPAR